MLAFTSPSSKKTGLSHEKLLLNKIHSYLYHLAKMITISQGMFANMNNLIHIRQILRTVIEIDSFIYI